MDSRFEPRSVVPVYNTRLRVPLSPPPPIPPPLSPPKVCVPSVSRGREKGGYRGEEGGRQKFHEFFLLDTSYRMRYMAIMIIKNLTPHAIALKQPDGTLIHILPSGQVARVSVTTVPVDRPGLPVPVVRNLYGPVEGLPDPQPGHFFVVSALVLARCAGRDDVYAPDTGPGAVRDEKGQIVAVTRLVAAPQEDI
jgi:hypothetical protein